eukprot:2420371-Lingulodinium_polyedra.AAC.1
MKPPLTAHFGLRPTHSYAGVVATTVPVDNKQLDVAVFGWFGSGRARLGPCLAVLDLACRL